MFSSDFEIDKSNSTITESKRFYEIIRKIGKPKRVIKGRQIIRAGTITTYFFFVEKGLFQSSKVINNKKYNLGFTFSGDIDCCPTSLLKGVGSNFSIEALENSEILVCELKDFRNECTEVEYLKIINGLLVFYLSVIEKRLIDAISLTAEVRYQHLLQSQPEKVMQIPIKLIAAYLGISTQSLSRIRRRIKV